MRAAAPRPAARAAVAASPKPPPPSGHRAYPPVPSRPVPPSRSARCRGDRRAHGVHRLHPSARAPRPPRVGRRPPPPRCAARRQPVSPSRPPPPPLARPIARGGGAAGERADAASRPRSRPAPCPPPARPPPLSVPHCKAPAAFPLRVFGPSPSLLPGAMRENPADAALQRSACAAIEALSRQSGVPAGLPLIREVRSAAGPNGKRARPRHASAPRGAHAPRPAARPQVTGRVVTLLRALPGDAFTVGARAARRTT